VPVTSRLAQEEIFGPVLVIIGFDDDDEAVRIANDSTYGLSGGVYAGDVDRAMAVANRLRTGTIAVNGAQWFDVESPFGGYKQSGLGPGMGAGGSRGLPGDEDGQLPGLIRPRSACPARPGRARSPCGKAAGNRCAHTPSRDSSRSW